MAIKNLIFDLGGVILDLDVPKTIGEFARVSGLTPEEVAHRFRYSDGFLKYERGEIGDVEFRDFVRELYAVSIPDDDLDACWNAMLLGIPADKLALLLTLRRKYTVFLLSNTNTIHLNYINSMILPPSDAVPSLDSYFDRAYYSHFMGKRKPEREIFEQVLDENRLLAQESLFLDDNAENIEGARIVGLQTAYVNTPDFILKYFNE